ncbi:MAG TPA: sigma-70 family RNA polymerase sigma factor, partial [Cytophagales bacterium]|nr:sigma-70 family RNA polymerase sigma factor [Cytophagales bacterium]
MDIINSSLFRQRLIAFAYHLLGNTDEAEDVVSETVTEFLERQSKGLNTAIFNLEAYLITTVKNKSLNVLNQKKRQGYIGVYLPEPVFSDAYKIDNKVDGNYAMTLVLSMLNPKERAIFLLRECFDFEYKELALEFDLSEEYCRKLYQRAKEKLDLKQKLVSAKVQQEMVQAIYEALHSGDKTSLKKYLKADIMLYSDGGGKIAAALKPIQGTDKVLRFMFGIWEKLHTEGDVLQLVP